MSENKYQLFAQRARELFKRAHTSSQPECVLPDALNEISAIIEMLRQIEEDRQHEHEAQLDRYAELEAECQHFRDLFTYAPIGYLTTRLDGTIRRANEMTQHLLHCTEQLLIGRSLASFTPEGHRRAFRAAIAQVQEHHEPQPITVRLQPAEGPAFDAMLIGVAARGQTGRPQELRWIVQTASTRLADRPQPSTAHAPPSSAHQLARGHVPTGSSRRPFHFLAEASCLLLLPTDTMTTFARLVHLAVLSFADLAILDVVADGTRVRHFAVARTGKHGTRQVQQSQQATPGTEATLQPLIDLLGQEPARLIDPVSDDFLVTLAADEQQLRTARQAHLRSALAASAQHMPYSAVVWTFATAEDVPYERYELTLASELVGRLSLTLGHLHRFAQA